MIFMHYLFTGEGRMSNSVICLGIEFIHIKHHSNHFDLDDFFVGILGWCRKLLNHQRHRFRIHKQFFFWKTKDHIMYSVFQQSKQHEKWQKNLNWQKKNTFIRTVQIRAIQLYYGGASGVTCLRGHIFYKYE